MSGVGVMCTGVIPVGVGIAGVRLEVSGVGVMCTCVIAVGVGDWRR